MSRDAMRIASIDLDRIVHTARISAYSYAVGRHDEYRINGALTTPYVKPALFASYYAELERKWAMGGADGVPSLLDAYRAFANLPHDQRTGIKP